jgi:peptidyl-prolyl cis-trans isomerase C
VARVNGVELTQRDLLREIDTLFPHRRTHGGRVPGPFETEIRRRALDKIVFDELIHQEALRRKMVVPAASLAEVKRQARQRFASQAEYEAYAVAEYGSVQNFERQLRRALLIALLTDQEITQRARVTPAEVQRFYTANARRFQKPESVWVQSISLNFGENATPAGKARARRRAEEVLPLARAAKSYEEFGLLAEKYSEDDWRIMMGDHKWIHRGRMPAAVEDAAFRLQPGQTSGIIETSEAYVIVRVNGRQPQQQIPFAQVRKTLQEDLERAKLEDARRKFEQQLRKTFKVEEF